MTRLLALVGFGAVVFASGCAHECRCVCVHAPHRAIAERGDDLSVPAQTRRRARARMGEPMATYSFPLARLTTVERELRPKPKPWGYPDPFEGDPFAPVDAQGERIEIWGKLDAAEDLFEAQTAATKHARSEPSPPSLYEAEAEARALELQRRMQQITQP